MLKKYKIKGTFLALKRSFAGKIVMFDIFGKEKERKKRFFLTNKNEKYGYFWSKSRGREAALCTFPLNTPM